MTWVPGRFPPQHFGKLYGLAMALSALVALLQYPCVALVQGPLQGDPFYVSVPCGPPEREVGGLLHREMGVLPWEGRGLATWENGGLIPRENEDPGPAPWGNGCPPPGGMESYPQE